MPGSPGDKSRDIATAFFGDEDLDWFDEDSEVMPLDKAGNALAAAPAGTQSDAEDAVAEGFFSEVDPAAPDDPPAAAPPSPVAPGDAAQDVPEWVQTLSARLDAEQDPQAAAALAAAAERLVSRFLGSDALAVARFGQHGKPSAAAAALHVAAVAASGGAEDARAAWDALCEQADDPAARADAWLFRSDAAEKSEDAQGWLEAARPRAVGDVALLLRMAAVAGPSQPRDRVALITEAAAACEGDAAAVLKRLATILAPAGADLSDDQLCPESSPTPVADLVLGLRHSAYALVSARLSEGEPDDARLALAAVMLSAVPGAEAGPAEASAVGGSEEAAEQATALLLRATGEVPRLAAAARLVCAGHAQAAEVITSLANTADERLGAGFCGALAALRGGGYDLAASAFEVAAAAGAPVRPHALLARLLGASVVPDAALAEADRLRQGALEIWRFVALALEPIDPQRALDAWGRAGDDPFALEGALRTARAVGDPEAVRTASERLAAVREGREAAQALMVGLLSRGDLPSDDPRIAAALDADPGCRPALDLALDSAQAAGDLGTLAARVRAAAPSLSPESAADLLVYAAWCLRHQPKAALGLLDDALGLRGRHLTAIALRPFFAAEALRFGDARLDALMAACEQVLAGEPASSEDPAADVPLRLADALAGAPRARPGEAGSAHVAAALLQADRAAGATMLAKAAAMPDAPVLPVLVGAFELGVLDTLGWGWSDDGWSDAARASGFVQAALAASDASPELVSGAMQALPPGDVLHDVLACLGFPGAEARAGAASLAAGAAPEARVDWLRLAAALDAGTLDASSLVELAAARPSPIVAEVAHRALVARGEHASLVLAHGGAKADPLALAVDLLAAGDPASAAPVAMQAAQGGGVVAELVAEHALEACESWEMLFHMLSQRRLGAGELEREAIETRRRWILSEKLPDSDAAWDLFRELHEDHPEDRDILENLARIAGARGEIELGVGFLSQLASSAPAPADAARYHRRIAEVYRRGLGQSPRLGGELRDDTELLARARQALLDALDYQPDDRKAIATLAELARGANDLPSLRQVLQREASLLDGVERLAQLEEIARISEQLAASPEEAVEGWRVVLEADPTSRAALDRLVSVAREHQLDDVFLDAAGGLTTQLDAEGAAALLFEMGVVAERMNRVDAALEHFEQAAGIEPPDCRAAERLVALHEARGDREGMVRALAVLGAHAETSEARGDAYLRAAAIEAEQRHDRASAAGWYEAALGQIPDHPEALRFLVAWMFEAGRVEDAIPLCERLEPMVLDADVSDFDARMESATFYHRYGEMLRSAGRPDDALTRFRRALDLNPAHLPSLEAVAPLLLTQRSWAEAEAAYRQLLQLTGGQGEPERVANLYTSLGVVERELGKDDGGYRRFHRALEVLPNYVPALQGIAVELERREDWNNLLTVYNNIIYHASQPQDVVEAYLTKGRILDEQLERPDKAWQHFERTLAFDAQALRAYVRLVELALRKGAWDDARSWAERGAAVVGEHDPLRADLHIGRAIAASAVQDHAEAEDALAAAVSADPGLGAQMRGVDMEDRAAWLALLRGRLPR